jgi:PadR family transcriptional regulator, regulatory protein PadR
VQPPIDILQEDRGYSYRCSTGLALAESQINLLQGTLDLLILKAIGDGEFHGPGVSKCIEQITHGTFRVKPGSLFPTLHRMEEAGWLISIRGDSGNNRRTRFCRRTKAGERQLGIEAEEWTTIARATANPLKAT